MSITLGQSNGGAMAKGLCHFCIKFFPIVNEKSTTRPFHHNVAALFKQSTCCALCSFIASHLNVGAFSQTQFKGTHILEESILIQLRLREPHSCDDGVRWAILEILLSASEVGVTRAVTRTFTISTCQTSCTLLSIVIFVATLT
jgi:hypothetical protein